MSVSDEPTDKKTKVGDATPKDSESQMKDRQNKSFVLRTLERKMSKLQLDYKSHDSSPNQRISKDELVLQ